MREPFSPRNLAHYALGVDVQLIPDSAFALTSEDSRETSVSDCIRAGIGDAPYFCFHPGPMSIDHRPGRRSTLYGLIAKLKEIPAEAVLVRSDPADGYVEQLAAETGSLFINAPNRLPREDDRGSGRSVLGHRPLPQSHPRRHQGYPSIAFASSRHKVHGGCEMLEVIGTPYDGTDLDAETPSLALHPEHYVQDRAALRHRLQEVCDRHRSETKELGSSITAVLPSSGVRDEPGQRVPAR